MPEADVAGVSEEDRGCGACPGPAPSVGGASRRYALGRAGRSCGAGAPTRHRAAACRQSSAAGDGHSMHADPTPRLCCAGQQVPNTLTAGALRALIGQSRLAPARQVDQKPARNSTFALHASEASARADNGPRKLVETLLVSSPPSCIEGNAEQAIACKPEQ